MDKESGAESDEATQPYENRPGEKVRHFRGTCQMESSSPRNRRARYVIWGILMWSIVDFGTAGGLNVSYFAKYGPLLLAYYVSYPLVFSYLIFSRKWNEKELFVATVAAMFVIEGILVRNPFVLAFPLLILGIPLAICIYAPLTYFPLWIVNGETEKHTKTIIALSAVVIATTALSVVSSW